MNIIGGVPFSHVTAQRGEPFRTGGRLIHRWFITISYLTKVEWEALRDVAYAALVSDIRRAVDGTPHTNGGASVQFRLAEWPENEHKQVYVTAISDDRTRFAGPDGFESSGRTIQLELEEA